MLKDALKSIKDAPITAKEEFVDRELEITKLQYAAYIHEGEIIGVCGERGSGKTSLLNITHFSGKEKIVIKIINRESKISIIGDIAEGIYNFFREKNPSASKKALRVFEKLAFNVREKKGVGISHILGANIEVEREERIYRASQLLKELLEEVGDAIIILDEIDKEKKEEILLIIDSIKDAFLSNKATLIITLPATIYREYRASKESKEETFNLENVFAEMIMLHPLSPSLIEEIVKRRIGLEYVEKGALEIIVDYAQGNPRRAIRTLKEAGLNALIKGKEKIGEREVIEAIKEDLKYFVQTLGLSEKERKALQSLDPLKKESAAVQLMKKGISKTSAYRVIAALKEKGLLSEEGGKIKLSKTALYLKKARVL